MIMFVYIVNNAYMRSNPGHRETLQDIFCVSSGFYETEQMVASAAGRMVVPYAPFLYFTTTGC